MAGWNDIREIVAWQRAESVKLRVYSLKEFARFVRIARGSETEALNHLIDARDQRLLTEDELFVEEHYIRGALKAAAGLTQHLKSTPDSPRPKKNREPNRT